MAELQAEHVKLGAKPNAKVEPWDRLYLISQLQKDKFAFDARELSRYFELGAVTKGILDITAKMYGLEYRSVAAPAWHPDVLAGGEVIGRIYLDLYSRPNKFKHTAMFNVRTPKKLADGRMQLPMAALECNFPSPGAEPALMQHDDVVTFFHEFGHVLHHLF